MYVISMIGIALMKKDMQRYVQDVRAVKGMGQGFSDHHFVLCKVKLVGGLEFQGEVVTGTRRIRNEKLREHQYVEGYATYLESKSRMG